MNARSTYAFYGSLRRGMSNYQRYKNALEFLFQDTLGGYQLYALENYPYAVRTGNPADLITVEIFKVTNTDMERSIHELEIGVGYYYDEIPIRGALTGIYLFEKKGHETFVKNGDWVQFFGS